MIQRFLVLCLFVALPAMAELSLHRIFQDHAVLQRDVELPVWGHGQVGSTVTARFADQTVKAKVGADGQWKAVFNALPASTEPRSLTVTDGKSTITREDLLVGDVWLASGQSNMTMSLATCDGGKEAAAAANFSEIRLLCLDIAIHHLPHDDLPNGEWVAATTPKAVSRFSAVGYWFATHLQPEIGVPIGVIEAAAPGTRIEMWVPASVLMAQESFARNFDAWDAYKRNWKNEVFPKLSDETAGLFLAKSTEETVRLQQLVNKAKRAKQEPPPEVAKLDSYKEAAGLYRRLPAGLYNAMIAPLHRFPLKGVIWYQGESNSSNAQAYSEVLTALIRSWREANNQPELPFLIVSLPGFRAPPKKPGEGGKWVAIRDVQWQIQETEKQVGTIITIDLGDEKNLHPKRKLEVGQRLALLARNLVYGQVVEAEGPCMKATQLEGNNLRIYYFHGAGLKTSDGKAVTGFEIKDRGGDWHFAEGRILGDSVLIKTSIAGGPIAVRYAWAENPPVNLYNGAGLPAVPFRTDHEK